MLLPFTAKTIDRLAGQQTEVLQLCHSCHSCVHTGVKHTVVKHTGPTMPLHIAMYSSTVASSYMEHSNDPCSLAHASFMP